MSRTKQQQDVNYDLLKVLVSVDNYNSLHNPVEWLTKSNLAKFFKRSADNSNNPELITVIYEGIFRVHTSLQKDEVRSKVNKVVAKLKANQTLPLKIWAVCFYLNAKKCGQLTKKSAAPIIRGLLVQYYPDRVPKGKHAVSPGDIPSIETIRTEWLKNI